MTKPESLLRSLTSHLGIDYVLTTHTDKDGTSYTEHHLFCEDAIIQEVLRWSLKFESRDRVRIFEGDPPPF